MVLFFQLTSGLCLTSQLCPKKMSVPSKSVTAASNVSLYLLILIFRGATLVTSPFFVPLSGAVHTGVEVHRMDLEMSGLVERPWLQLMCCAVCLPRGRNFRWRRGSPSGSECWMVCHCWTPEIEFNKRLSSSIIRLANYSVTTSLIYKWKV